MRISKYVYFFVLLYFTLPYNALGRVSLSDNDFEQINNNVTFGIVGLGIKYVEKITEADPTKPSWANDTENGVIPGLGLGVKVTFYKKLYTELHVDYFSGELRYDGADRYPPYTPRTLRLSHRISNTDAKVGYVLLDKDYFQLIPYAGLGYRFWDRLYNSPNNREQYHNLNAILGMKMNFLLTEDLFLSPYVHGGEIFYAKMKHIGNGLKFNLGPQPIFQGGLELNYRLFDEFFLNCFVNYTHFQYGKSQFLWSQSDGKFHAEPKSKTDEIKAGIGISFSWIP